jgi:hypothetical protein
MPLLALERKRNVKRPLGCSFPVVQSNRSTLWCPEYQS